ncbi:hypothetical protein QFC19_004728 [Naganishia cerealis]|uniref:Uncharacterized protein n=1 Tax=Naganishia cerealis TaxID=610337 RepID=A0ACC2VU72_9TREE|nr:hypothetical protein QFC19_004728 [Naganishia cerealis]
MASTSDREPSAAFALPLERFQESGPTLDLRGSESDGTIQAVPDPDFVRGPKESVPVGEVKEDKKECSTLNSKKWLISVSSAVPQGKMIANVVGSSSQMVNPKDDFVIYVSEPNCERTLVRSSEDFYRLHHDLLADGELVQELPLLSNRHDDLAGTGGETRPKHSQPPSPSKQPKKKRSSFFAKVRSVFRDSEQQAKPCPPIQNQNSEFSHVSRTDPLISPPHSPATRPHAELGLFDFEKGNTLGPTASPLMGERTTAFLSLTPSNSSGDNAKGDNVKQICDTVIGAVADRRRTGSSSTLGTSALGSPKLSDPHSPEGSSDAILQPSHLPISSPDAMDLQPLQLDSPSSTSNREGVYIGLANYLSALCKDETLSTSLALREFFTSRPSDLENQSNKQRDLASRNTGIIAYQKAQDEDSSTIAFNIDVSILGDSLPRRIRSVENGISETSMLSDAKTATKSVTDAFLETSATLIHPVSSSTLSEADHSRLGMPTLTTVPQIGTGTQLSDDVSASETFLKQAQMDGPEDCSPVPQKILARRPLTVDDFDLIRTLGKGCAGKVVLVRHKQNRKVYAMKAMVKRHVIAHSELQHTLIEQAVLKRMSTEDEQVRNPFIVKLWWSFHDDYNLYLVLDFHPGGDLATQLSRWGRLGRDRARFYTAEIVEGVEGLHAAGVIYRDLKPENVLLGSDGHIVLVDFGLAADFFPNHRSPGCILPHWMADGSGQAAEDGRLMLHRHATDVVRPKKRDVARSFVGTAEYLAPEVIKGLPYSYEVDWWSLGTMLYEALIGNTPFWAENHAEMYVKVLHDDLVFPEDNALDRDTRSFIRGSSVYPETTSAPYIPPTDSSLEFDTSNFDKTFLLMDTNLKRESVNSVEDADHKNGRVRPHFDEKAFSVYDFGESEMIYTSSEGRTTEKIEPCSGPSQGDADSDNCQTKRDDDGDLASSSDSVSLSVSDFGPENGLGTSATQQEGSAEEHDSDSISGTIDALEKESSAERTSEEMTPAVLERIQTLASEPGIKASSRHSRDFSRLSVDLEHRHHLEAGDRQSADDWSILEEGLRQQAPNGRKVSETLFAKGVVDAYRLALRRKKGTARLSKQPSWRSPAASLILSKTGGGNNVGDTEKATSGFLTPLSPTLAGIKSKFKNRSRSKQRFLGDPTSTKARVPGRSLHIATHESADQESNGMTSSALTPIHGLATRETSQGENERNVSSAKPSDDMRKAELEL